MSYNFFSPFLLAGAFQGLILSLFILKHNRTKSNFFIAAAISIASISTFFFSIDNVHEFVGCVMCNILTRVSFFLFAPLIYLYLYFKINPKSNVLKKLYHFLPFFLLAILSVVGYYNWNIINLTVFKSIMPIHLNTTYTYEILRIIHITIYFILIMKLIKKHDFSISRAMWLKRFILFCFTAYLFVSIGLRFNYYDATPSSNSFSLTYLLVPTLIFWLTYQILRTKESHIIINGEIKVIKPVPNSGELEKNIDKFFEETKFHLNQGIKLDDIANQLDISRHLLSKLILNTKKVRFNEFINSMRVEEAKRLIENGKSENFTLEAVGQQVGFKSKTTFIKAFKKSEGLTPSDFRNSVLK